MVARFGASTSITRFTLIIIMTTMCHITEIDITMNLIITTPIQVNPIITMISMVMEITMPMVVHIEELPIMTRLQMKFST